MCTNLRFIFRVNQTLIICGVVRKTETAKIVLALGKICKPAQTGPVVGEIHALEKQCLKKQERKAIRGSHSAMKSAMSVISGDPDKRAMFDMAMERVADDVADKVGEMERFMEMSSGFMDSIDLQNGVFEEEGIKMLEEYEKRSNILLMGDGTNTENLDLNIEVARPESRQEDESSNDYKNLFESSAENGDESVFEIQYTGVEPAGWDCIICSEGSYFPKFCGPRSPYDNQEFVTGWGFCLPSQELYDLFDATDARRDVTFYDLRDQQDSYSQGRDDTGLFNKKYIPRKADDRAGSDPLNFANNYRSIRYADVLLMAAEADVLSGGANAETYLNEVRARAYGDSSHDFSAAEGDLLDAIYLERRKELAGEGHRFFDLVRTNKAAAAIPGFTANKNEVFPIPLIELELANAVGRWGQNQGY